MSIYDRLTPSACSETRRLQDIYADLRLNCIALEEWLEANDDRSSCFIEPELKRLDKAVTVMKVAFKVVKKVIKKHEQFSPSVVAGDFLESEAKQQ